MTHEGVKNSKISCYSYCYNVIYLGRQRANSFVFFNSKENRRNTVSQNITDWHHIDLSQSQRRILSPPLIFDKSIF